MDLRQIFSKNLRRLRHAKGMSQEALADAANVNRTYLSKLEKGTSWPGLEILGKLSDVLGVDPTALISRSELVEGEEPNQGSARKP